ncbi:MAG: geranylgeranyl reductase family protein [Candidatus Heimdallarchaeota archaeon]|nr:MAG: geranylgeranyl reductase family protein [Candidatus Heimdallarchaeota archaeon]
MDVDILIVGLGPAGATVLSKVAPLIESEFSILAIDHRPKPGFPVQCGEFMPSPDEMSALVPDVPNAREFFTFDNQFISTHTDHISFFSPKGKIIQTPFQGYSLYRGNWNSHLIEIGKKHGAEVWTSACVVSKKNGQVTIARNNAKKVHIKPQIIIGADGVNSRIAKWTGLSENRHPKHFVIVKQHLMVDIKSKLYDSSDVQMFFGENYAPGAYAWIIPKSDSSANVGTGIRLPMLKGDMNVSKALSNLINHHPIASQTLKNAHISQTIAGVVPVGPPYQKTVNMETKTLLVGDSACQVVSSVGGGIPPSMVAGAIAANTIDHHLRDNSPLSDYQVEWKQQMQKMFNRAYKLRQFFDAISTDRDSRIQWYMNRLSSSDINKVVHCAVPWKLSLVAPFMRFLNWIIK